MLENMAKYMSESVSIWYSCYKNHPGARTGVVWKAVGKNQCEEALAA